MIIFKRIKADSVQVEYEIVFDRTFTLDFRREGFINIDNYSLGILYPRDVREIINDTW